MIFAQCRKLLLAGLADHPGRMLSGSADPTLRGSCGVDQAVFMVSIELAGSDRVRSAQISSSMFERSISASMTYFPVYAPTGTNQQHSR